MNEEQDKFYVYIKTNDSEDGNVNDAEKTRINGLGCRQCTAKTAEAELIGEAAAPINQLKGFS